MNVHHPRQYGEIRSKIIIKNSAHFNDRKNISTLFCFEGMCLIVFSNTGK